MTKLMAVIAIALVIFGGYKLWEVWDDYDHERDVKAEEAKKKIINPDMLSGMPPELRDSFAAAQSNGSFAVKNWLKANGARLEDPRRAWVELDYMISIFKEDPVEAKKIYSMVQSRVPTNSPVYPRVQQLRATYGQ